MNYEKAYKKSLEKAKGIINYYKEHNRGDESAIEDLEIIFPELKESEDKKIRKAILELVKQSSEILDKQNQNNMIAWLEKQGEPTTIDIDKMVLKYSQTRESCTNGLPVNCQIRAYRQGINDTLRLSFNLEKQGEQKVPINDFKAKNWYVSEVDGKIHDMTYNPADKVEPKFHEGDWIINDQGSAFQIAYIDIENCRYVFEIGGYTKEEMNYENIAFANNHYRKWTLDDAKDGDVLAAQECYVIFKEIDGLNIKCYCTYHYMGFNPSFHINTLQNKTAFHPATKEQRDLLFAKMKEAGYQWNPDKKELKLLISNGGDFEYNNSKQKPTWSEEDERIVTALMEGFRYHQLFNPRFGEVPNAEIIDWIKSLKGRLS